MSKSKKILSLTLALILTISMCTILSLSASLTTYDTATVHEQMDRIVARINVEYGTEMSRTTDEELIAIFGEDYVPEESPDFDPVEFESRLRYIAEYEIPEIERRTLEAEAKFEARTETQGN